MSCNVASLELSSRLDGARDTSLDDMLEEHLASCPECRRFEAGARRLREATRLETADDVPDLVPRIMAAVRTERRPIRHRPQLRGWTRPAAAFVAGAAASALLLSGLPFQRRTSSPASASEIPRLVAAAAKDVGTYRAQLEILERNFRPQVPERRFDGGVWFGAPETFGVEIHDRTRYPSRVWPRNDVAMAVDGSRWSLWSPANCPGDAAPPCQAVYTSVRGREPFDGDAVLPTDIVVPVSVLAGTDRVEVIGSGHRLGRPVVTIAMPYSDAGPLFAYLHTAGTWRPFFPADRVIASLDAQTWFPLAYEVRASASPLRQRWVLAHGMPTEAPDGQLFSVRVTSFQTGGAKAAVSAPVTQRTRDEGFRDLRPASIAQRVGYEPLVPRDLAGLRQYRAGVFADADRPRDESLLSFARGLAWLKIRETRRWSEPALYGNLGTLAGELVLSSGGVAYYEPATATLGRRLSIHARGWDVSIETNLPRSELLRVAASLPIDGVRAPKAWNIRRWAGGIVRERVSLREALRIAPYALYPAHLPKGYVLGVVHVVRVASSSGVTFFFRRDATEPDGVGLRLHQTRGHALPPPVDPGVFVLSLRGSKARYSPERGELEWIEDDVYRSLTGPSVELSTLLDVARSLRAHGNG